MFERLLCKTVIVFLLALPVATRAAEAFVRPVLSCPRVSTAPAIDGGIDDPAWQAATRVSNFSSSYGDRQAVEQTEVFVCHDTERLYIAVRSHGTQMGQLRARETQHDGNVFWDDSVEIFLDPGLTRLHFMQFIVNSVGTVMDQKVTEITELGWTPRAEVASTVGPDAWTAELAIPFAGLGLEPPQPGARWGMNVTRTTFHLREYSCWSPTGCDRFQVPDRFADMVFTDSAGLRVDIGEVNRQTAEIECTVDGWAPRPLRLEVAAVSSEGEQRTVGLDVTAEDFGRPHRMHYLLPGGWDGFLLSAVIRDAETGDIVYRSPSIPVPATADAKLEQTRAEMQRLRADMVLLSAAATRSGYVLTPAKPFETVLPRDLPDANAAGEPVRVTACAGEYEPGSVLLYTARALRNVTVALESDLTCGASSIPRSAVDLRILKCWYQGGHGQKYFRPVLVPELLLKDDALISVDEREQVNQIQFEGLPDDGPVLAPFNVPAYSNKKIWLTVNVPPHTPAGVYKTRVLVTPGNRVPTAVDLEVRVLPFTLRDADKLYTIYYYSPRVYHFGASPEVLVNELQDMRAHGLTSAALMSYDTDFAVAADGGYRVNLTTLKRELDLRVRSGLTGSVILSLQTHKPPFPTRPFRGPWAEDNALDPDDAEKLAFLVREIQALVRENDFPAVFILGIDEPNFDSTGTMLERCKRIFETIHGADEQAGTATTTDIEGNDTMGDSIDMPIYNAFAAYHRLLYPPEHSVKKTELIYWHPLENPVHDRFHFGLMVWCAKLDGACPYAYRHVYQGDPYRREDSRDNRKGERNSMYTYPSQTGPIPTIQWESTREGIDDVRYLQTLSHWVDRADTEGSRGEELERAIATARDLLATPLVASPDYHAFLDSLSPATFDTLRENVINAILKIRHLTGDSERILGDGAGPQEE